MTPNEFNAIILFMADASVGMFPYSYKMELDCNLKELFLEDSQYREEVRQKIKSLYEELDNDSRCVVWFSDERQDEQPDLLGQPTEQNEIGNHSMNVSAGHDNKTDWKDEQPLPKTFPFEKYAVKCDTWEEMLELVKLADKQGIAIHSLSKLDFEDGNIWFANDSDLPHYSNYNINEDGALDKVFSHLTEISYTDFLKLA